MSDDEFVEVGLDNTSSEFTLAKSEEESTSDYRKSLVKEYHKECESLVEKIFTKDLSSSDMIGLLAQEIAGESDNLLANHLIATEGNHLKEASIIQKQRAEVLKDIVKIIQTQKAIETQNSIDVNSPSMAIVFRYFFSSLKDAMDELKYDNDQMDVLINECVRMMGDWRKELKKKIEEM